MPNARPAGPSPRPAFEPLEGRRLFDAGGLDPSFGDDGVVDLRVPGFTASAEDVAALPDGRIVVVGVARGRPEGTEAGDTQRRLIVQRLYADGTPDPSFGDGGRATVDLASLLEQIDATTRGGPVVAAYPDGEFGGQFAVAVDGDVYTFGPGGATPLSTRDAAATLRQAVGLPADSSSITVADLLAGPDGRLTVSGRVTDTLDATSVDVVARLLPDGSLDPTSAGGGAAVVAAPADALGDDDDPFNLVSSRLGAIAFDPAGDGSVLAAGTFQGQRPSDVDDALDAGAYLLRLAPDGMPDDTFGDGGDGSTVFGFDDAGNGVTVSALAPTPSGGAVVIGSGNTDVFRFGPDGAPDPTFGTAGRASVPLPAGDDIPDGLLFTGLADVAVQNDGRVVIASGLAEGVDGAGRFGVFRLDADGTPDESFGTGGARVGPGSTGDPADPLAALGGPRALALARDGTILAAGGTFGTDVGEGTPTTGGLGLARLFADDRPVGDLTAPGLTVGEKDGSLRFKVAWRDDDGLDASTFDSSDLLVVTPGGERRRAYFLGLSDVLADGVTRVANYKLTPPSGGGSFSQADVGRYQVRVVSNRIADADGHRVAGRALGVFDVRPDPFPLKAADPALFTPSLTGVVAAGVAPPPFADGPSLASLIDAASGDDDATG